MVLSGHALSNSALHKSRKGWEHVDGWVDVLGVERPVHVDLALSDVASQIGNGVGDIIGRHGQNGDLCDGPSLAFHSPGSLVKSG